MEQSEIGLTNEHLRTLRICESSERNAERVLSNQNIVMTLGDVR